MKEAIEEILANVDSEEFYKEYLPDIVFNSIGQAKPVKCCFHEDDTPSLSISTDKGFKCFGCDVKGKSLIGFYWKWLQIVDGRKITLQISVKKLYSKYVHPLLNPKIVTNWHNALLRNVTIQKILAARGIELNLIKKYELGYDVDDERISIPIYNRHGWIQDIRKYSLKSGEDRNNRPKNLPYDYLTATEKREKGEMTYGTGGRLFPYDNIYKGEIILCEGELDCIILNHWGFNSVTAGSVTDWGRHLELFKDKRIYICFDNDVPGQKAARELLSKLYPLARIISNIVIPLEGGDVTDFWKAGLRAKDFSLLMEKSDVKELVIPEDNSTAYEVVPLPSLVDLHNPKNYGKYCSITARVSGEAKSQYALPLTYTVTCDQSMGKMCYTCPMSAQGGVHVEKIDLKDKKLLEFIGINLTKLKEETALRHDIPKKCTRFTIENDNVVYGQKVLLSPVLERTEGKICRDNIECLNLSGPIELNTDHIFEGYNANYPNSQESVFVILKAIPQDSLLKSFTAPSKEKVKEYKRKFNPKELTPEGILEKHNDLMSILAHNVTGIYARNDLHSVVDLNYHSPLEIIFKGKRENSFMDTAIIGDTNTGKNDVVDSISAYYNAGLVVNASSCTKVGLIGGVNKQGFFCWGTYVQQHRRHITINEASKLGKDIFGDLRDIREGKADYNKSDAKRQTLCTSRVIFISNDPSGLLSSNPYPIMALSTLYKKEADISRFTNAFFLREEDNPTDIINGRTPPKIKTDVTQEDFQFKLANAWTIKAENIEFVNGSFDKCNELAKKMSKKYKSSIFLVQSAVQGRKIATIAAALALNLYHMNEDGTKLLVTWQFIVAAAILIESWYDSEACEYNLFAEQEQARSIITNPKMIMKSIFDKERKEGSTGNLLHCLQFLVSRREFTSNCVQDAFLFCTDHVIAKEIIKVLHLNNCIERYGPNYRKTRAFTTMLKKLLKEEKELV